MLYARVTGRRRSEMQGSISRCGTCLLLDAAAFASCGNCHVNAGAGAYYPGNLHSALANLNLAQPSGCLDCHASSKPIGFVGLTAINPARTPASGEMKHDAVL